MKKQHESEIAVSIHRRFHRIIYGWSGCCNWDFDWYTGCTFFPRGEGLVFFLFLLTLCIVGYTLGGTDTLLKDGGLRQPGENPRNPNKLWGTKNSFFPLGFIFSPFLHTNNSTGSRLFLPLPNTHVTRFLVSQLRVNLLQCWLWPARQHTDTHSTIFFCFYISFFI